MYETSLNCVKDLLGDKFQKCESPSLRLNKLLRLGDDSKKEEIDFVCKSAQNHQKQVIEFSPNGSEKIYAKLLSRLIVNQAGGILENSGLCLHRFFGYPMIPGSAVKGIASHAAWCEWNDIPEEESARKLAFAEKIASVFGYPTNHKDLDDKLEEEGRKDKKYSGTICFLDAVPYECNPRLVTDIITCHHKDYYGGKKDKAIDDEQPIPIPFLAIDKDATFKFTLVPLARCNDENMADAKKWLLDALTIHGAGAKTAAGYGWFCDVTKNIEEVIIQKQANAEKASIMDELKSKIESLICRIATDTPPTRDEYNSTEQIFNKFKDTHVDFYNSLRESMSKIKNSLPEQTFRDKLIECDYNNFKGKYLKQFSKLKEEEKTDIVLFLRESSGVGQEYWSSLKNESKKDVKQAVEAIRAHNSKLNLIPKKMP
jgi:CRISPR type III-B/RAMP module RAMP protein Cmr6